MTDFTLHISLTFTKFLYNKFIPLSYPEIIVNPLLLFAPLFMSFVMTLDNNDYLSRCSKLIAYMNLIKKVMHFKCLYALFWPVCPALIGRVARYTPSSELNIQTKIGLYRYCPWMRGMATSQISCNNGIDKKASHVPL